MAAAATRVEPLNIIEAVLTRASCRWAGTRISRRSRPGPPGRRRVSIDVKDGELVVEAESEPEKLLPVTIQITQVLIRRFLLMQTPPNMYLKCLITTQKLLPISMYRIS